VDVDGLIIADSELILGYLGQTSNGALYGNLDGHRGQGVFAAG
jgi:hypothetical protein